MSYIEDLIKNDDKKYEFSDLQKKKIKELMEKYEKELNSLDEETKVKVAKRFAKAIQKIKTKNLQDEDDLDDLCEDVAEDIAEIIEEAEDEDDDDDKDFFKISGLKANTEKKTKKLLQILPFLDEEDVHEVVTKFLEGDAVLSGNELVAVLPFASEEDCNALFMRTLEKGDDNYNPVAIAPFVSEECLSKVVDRYLAGEFKDLNINALYPFISSKDAKRLFIQILKDKE
ncbi:MAG: hypothetical protein PHW67_00455 [Bacilli bacterium]|nr:hypothetical protein [Bacilli bacterium]